VTAPAAAASPAPDPQWRATYRLQLTADFGFAAAEAVVPYLRDLGISHLYLSPPLESVAGSTHGYDGTDPTRVSEERGGEAALRSLAAAAGAAGMGIVADIVPNHLAASDETPWWVDEVERAEVFDVDTASGWYRRFFDIDGVAGVRQEDPRVFDRTHAKILELVRDGVVHGLRVDHPDGLADPAAYLQRLRDLAGVPIWVEKVLYPGEMLRPWPVAGTVGYGFACEATALFVDPAGEAVLTETYRDLTNDHQSFEQVALAAERQLLAGPFRRELDRLCELAPDLDRATLAEAVVGFPIYRTYVEPTTGRVTEEDRRAVDASGASAELARRLLLDDPGHDELVVRFQQTTAPVTAKGVEDTAFYRSTRLLALNEVGGDPTRFGVSVDAFHAGCVERADREPQGLLAATTHDAKRSADSRARIGALAGMADDFGVHVRRWFEASEHLVGDHGPTPAERWFLFQSLLGAWPLTTDRLDAFLRKAMREAKVETTWVDPRLGHEDTVLRYAHDLFTLSAFTADFLPFVERVAVAGERASVGQTLLRATTPGVCDVYQGDETWFLAMVDPDNRRAFDWKRRMVLLDQTRAGAEPTRATAKLHVLHLALALRARRPAPFDGPYRPLEAGPATVAFLRGEPGGEILVVVPVRPDPHVRLTVPAGHWRDALGGIERHLPDEVSVADLVAPLGVGCWENLG